MGDTLAREMYEHTKWVDWMKKARDHRDRPMTELDIDELVRLLLEDKARGFDVVRLEGRGTLFNHKSGYSNVLMTTEGQI